MDFVRILTEEISVIPVSQNMPNSEVRFFSYFINMLVGNECKNCSNDHWYYIKFVLFFGIQIVIVLYSI